MKTALLIFLFNIFASTLFAQEPSLIPQPVNIKIKRSEKPFIISNSTKIIVERDSVKNSADFFNHYLEAYFQLSLVSTPIKPTENYISLVVDRSMNNLNGFYTLNVTDKSIIIKASSYTGIFYGIQSLIQLLPVQKELIKIPSVNIVDYPRFAYRGMHLDVSRHFFDVAFIKRYIDYLALHKMNYFHWHLTDDHGWRIEIKKYPKLTEIGAWRNGSIIGLYPGTGNDGTRYGGYYTQEQIKEIVKYAADRYITIIPEIEMPGHSMAVLASYPELGTTPQKITEVAQTWGIFNKFNNVLVPSPQTFNFLEHVLSEVMDLFPAQYIHIGGDECSKIWWNQSAFCQNLVKEKGLKDMNGLQSYFIQTIEKFVNSKGKTVIGWDEILDGGLAPNAIVMSWRGEKGGISAAQQQHKVIMTPENKMYFNHAQFVKEDSLTAKKFLPLADVYHYEPIPAELSTKQAQYVWGAQGNLWSEYITNPAKVEYMLFPRLDALSEILWSPKEKRNYDGFKSRLKAQFKRYDLMGLNYSKKYLQQIP